MPGYANRRLLSNGHPWVVLLSRETYYPRFGFAPTRNWNLTGNYGSRDAFQFLPLTAAASEIRGGHICYAPEFEKAIGRLDEDTGPVRNLVDR